MPKMVPLYIPWGRGAQELTDRLTASARLERLRVLVSLKRLNPLPLLGHFWLQKLVKHHIWAASYPQPLQGQISLWFLENINKRLHHHKHLLSACCVQDPAKGEGYKQNENLPGPQGAHILLGETRCWQRSQPWPYTSSSSLGGLEGPFWPFSL